MQYSNEKFQRLCVELDALDLEDHIATYEIWEKMKELILESEESFQAFLQYMYTDMTAAEYGTFSEISDDIAFDHPSWEFVDAYHFLERKYPEETARWDMRWFINTIERIVTAFLGERPEKGESPHAVQ